MSISVLAILVLIALGFAVRVGVRPVWRLHLPASVIAGAIGLVLIQSSRAAFGPAAWLDGIVASFRSWPGPLIALVFAGLLMERADRSRVSGARDVARQGIAAWIVVLGQVLIGTLLTWLWFAPAYGVPGTFGQLIEVGMAGGPGTARAMGDVYQRQFNFPAGLDLGLLVATFGLVWGLISGIALARLGIRRRWTTQAIEGDAGSPRFVSGIEPESTGRSLGTMRVRPDVLDPLTLQAVLLGLAFATGWLLQLAWVSGLRLLEDPKIANQFVDKLADLPLFVFTTFGGWIVREALYATRLERLLDAPTLQRLTGVALDVVIVASIAAISPTAVVTYALPIAVMLVLAAAWCVFNLLWVSPRLLPRRYWFELGLMNYGFATATTPQSMLLLKLVDPDVKSGAAETYAAAVPLSAPFVGGGILTFVLFPLVILQFGVGMLSLLCGIAIIALWFAGRRLARE